LFVFHDSSRMKSVDAQSYRIVTRSTHVYATKKILYVRMVFSQA
jgi:hypothetical protein